MKTTRIKQNKGITLIALVITIIVLIILAGISINLLFGDNGIIKKAQSAKQASESASELEQIRLAMMEALINEKTTGNVNLETVLRNNLDETKLKSIKSNGNVAKIEYGDNEYTVDLKTGNTNKNDQEVDKWDGVSKSSGLVGEGTEAKPYLIRSAADLNYMSEMVAKWSNIIGLTESEIANGCDIRANDAIYKLTTNISLENIDYLPIGQYIEDGQKKSGTFYGIFDGNNYEISKVKIHNEDNINLGFFSNLCKAQIKNLILTDIDFKGKGNIGGIAGNLYTYNYSPIVTISNCYVSGKIISDKFLDTSLSNYSLESWCVGGIVGDTNGPVTIENCTTNLEILGNRFIGGIVGEMKDNLQTVDGKEVYTSKIINCVANGKVIGHQRVGGLVGQGYNFYIVNSVNNAQIKNSDAPSTNPSSDDLKEEFIGGLVGNIDGRALIENTYSTGNITMERYVNYLGGLAGMSSRGIINNCYNTGNITCTGNVSSLGGLFGGYSSQTNMSVCKNSYYRGNITLDTSKTIQNVGRIIGYLYGPNGDLEGCSNTGTMIPTSEDIGKIQ